MRVFIFSDLNLISITPILKKYCSLIDDIIHPNSKNGLGRINKYNKKL